MARRKKKLKAEAYFVIRQGLNFVQQRNERGFFNSLLGDHGFGHDAVKGDQPVSFGGLPETSLAFFQNKSPIHRFSRTFPFRK